MVIANPQVCTMVTPGSPVPIIHIKDQRPLTIDWLISWKTKSAGSTSHLWN